MRAETLANGTTVYITKEHRFGTDAFVLTHFASPRAGDIVVDLGSGCGIMPLICADRYAPQEVWGVELQRDAHELLCRAVLEAGLAHIHPLHADLRERPDELPRGRCTLVLCNPPYTEGGGGLLSEGDAARIARHETMCTFADIAAAARSLLQFRGRLCVSARPERLVDIVCDMRAHRLEPKRLRFVHKHADTPPWLALIEGIHGGQPFLTVEPPLIVYDGGELSDEMHAAYGK